MIRTARPSDRDQVVALAEAFVVEAGFTDPVSKVAVAAQVDDVLDKLEAGSGIGLVLEHAMPFEDMTYQLVVGFIGGIVRPHPLTGLLTAFELAWFVAPAHRKGIGGFKLLKGFEREAKMREAQLVQLSALDAHVGGFLRRSGYTARETTYTLPL